MVSFELGIEIEKDVFCHVTSVGQRKKDWGERGTKRKISEFLSLFWHIFVQRNF